MADKLQTCLAVPKGVPNSPFLYTNALVPQWSLDPPYSGSWTWWFELGCIVPSAGRLGLVAVLSDAASMGRYLSGVGLAAEPPAVAAARPPPQHESIGNSNTLFQVNLALKHRAWSTWGGNG